MEDYRGKRVTVMGLGTFGGGIGAATFFARRGACVTVTDLRPAAKLEDSIARLKGFPIRFVLGEHRVEDFTSADLVVASPAVKYDSLFLKAARRAGVPVTHEMNILFEMCAGRPILGVTGSNGKSTTTALIGEMVRSRHAGALIGGNLGGSLLIAADESPDRSAPLVIEISSFQLFGLRRLKVSPNVAVITNITPNHLDWHGTFRAYAEAKRNILRFQKPGDVAVLNGDDPLLRRWARRLRSRAALFSIRVEPRTEKAAFLRGGHLMVRWEGREFRLVRETALKIPGRHNLANALAASLGAVAFGVEPWHASEAIVRFGGLPHRLEMVAEAPGNIRFFNDSIATTPESAICAMETFPPPITLIAGGSDKGVSFDGFAAVAVRRTRRIILMGATADKLEAALIRAASDAGRCPTILRAENLEQACAWAAEGAVTGETILLSPACASFDQFRNFEERGAAFRSLALRAAMARITTGSRNP
ncbi:MAG: UDP-N-acetylmuramoyl-L-alanine--D-glutamate ligase [Planctomycetota bacterium]|nr:UDP-N-acetylmuramoyl-L-alanine--D-glutamate ligase [Planctomycetota bacterium]